MTAAVENLITTIRRKNAEEEAKIVSQKKQEVVNQAKQTKQLADQAKKSQGAIDKFVGDLKKGKKTKGGEVIASRLSGVEKDQLKTLNSQLASDKQSIAQLEQQNRLQELNNKIQTDQTQATRDLIMRSRGISENELAAEEQTRAELKMQKQVLEQMLVSDTMTAEQIKGTREYQEKATDIERQERRLEARADRQVRMQNIKQTMSLQGISKGLVGLKSGIMGLGGKALGATKDAMKSAGGGLMAMLKTGGLVAAFFGLKAFLDSKMFENLTEFMKSLAPQFELVFGGFKKLFQGDIIGGLIDIFKGLGQAIYKILDSAVTGLYNAIARYFGLEETDSVFGAIINVFMKIYEFLTPLIDIMKKYVMDIFNSIVGGIKNIFEGIKGLFSGDFSIENFVKIFGGLYDIVFSGVRAAINMVAGLFGFDGIPDDWSITGALLTAVAKVKEFFANMFAFGSALKDKIFNIGTIFKGLAKGGIAAVKAILPGGESPGEAFRRVFNEVTKGDDIGLEVAPGGSASANLEASGNPMGYDLSTEEGKVQFAKDTRKSDIIIQQNQNNSRNSSVTQVQQTPVKSHDEIANSLTNSHAGVY